MLFCCLWHNVETSRHKHFIVVSRHQQTPPLTTSDKGHNLPRSGGAVLILITTSRSQRWKHAMKPDIDSKSRFLPIPPAFDAPVRGSPSEYRRDVWYEKTRMVWYPTVKKLKIMFIRFDRVHERNRRTDTQTDGHHMTAQTALHAQHRAAKTVCVNC